MKARFILFLVFVFCYLRGFSQSPEYNNPDTLIFETRTGGIIDTFDLAYSYPFSTMPSTGFSNSYHTLTTNTFRESSSLMTFQIPRLLEKKIVSALPHIGFAYSFGLKGTQFLHADYQHSLSENTLLNASIDRHSSGGFAQNNAYAYSNVKFGLYRNKNRFNIALKGTFSADERGLNNGIIDTLTDELDDPDLGIQFVPTMNASAASNHKGVNSEAIIKYNVLSDSVSLKIGPMVHSKFRLLNRVYTDELVFQRDQFQDASISNGLGLFIERNNFSVGAQGIHRYWRFQNLGTNRDTNEFSFQGDFVWKRKLIAFDANYYQNIIGAKSELKFSSRFRIGGKAKQAFVFAKFSDLLPTPLQRNYFGKYIDYSTSLSKQQILNVGVGGKYTLNKISFQAKSGLLNTNNNLVWSDSIWKINENSNLSLFYFDVKAHVNLGVFNWHPQVIIQTGSKYIPEFIFSGRVLIKKKVFEAKKLELQFSIDPQINSTYQLMSYDVNLDNLYFDSANRSGGVPFSMHSTVSLGIQEFRFFIRGENIQAFWTKGSTEILQNYYRSPFVLRLGLSWDFFN